MFNLLLNFSVVFMLLGAAGAMRVSGLAMDTETKKLSNLFWVPARIFYTLFPLNVIIYLAFYLFSEFSLGSAVFYLALIVITREMWSARQNGENSVERMDNMRAMKKTLILSLFFYAMFWLSKGLFAVG